MQMCCVRVDARTIRRSFMLPPARLLLSVADRSHSRTRIHALGIARYRVRCVLCVYECVKLLAKLVESDRALLWTHARVDSYLLSFCCSC